MTALGTSARETGLALRLKIRRGEYRLPTPGRAPGYAQGNLAVLPADLANFKLEDISAMGASITAMPVVNAIPAVVAARPGIVSYPDLTLPLPRGLVRP